MKLALVLGLLVSSLSSFAYVTDCDSLTKLSCTTKYYSLKNNQRVEEVVNSSANFELVNWDEPSVAYCEASVGFNQKGVYILATLSPENEVSVSITRDSSEDKTGHDYFSAKALINEKHEFNSSLSLSPTLKSGLYGLEVNCKITK